ncbi:MAG: peptidoglycan DD-metalloendopeptidase family protein [Actinobacteria bacterium]|nr:peptidoglycan DD-metalloendopeptidase family protein [Actinomycetota bacterium]MBW3641450.1 peptidoglycan DD-metalloendopeptidase family protein [Actinomycetota bacterium]
MGALAVALVAVVLVLPAASAEAEGELDDARREANALAGELAASQSRLAELEDEVARLERQAADGNARRAALQGALREVAVDRFIRGATPLFPVRAEDLHAMVRAEALARFAARDNVDAIDEYRRAGQDLEAAVSSLEGVRAQATAAVADFRRRVATADATLVRLQRLDDERRAREEAERAAAARAVARPERGTAAPSPRRPGRSSPNAVAGDWACPVQGPRAFTNDWGQPRSGGRRHQGNDILSPRGTPVVASVGGTVRPHQSSLGGSSYYLRGDDGNTYFGTHLHTLSGANGRVEKGTVLGTVGNSGNAAGGPTHLHFEIHPGGGGPVNPYPTLTLHC